MQMPCNSPLLSASLILPGKGQSVVPYFFARYFSIREVTSLTQRSLICRDPIVQLSSANPPLYSTIHSFQAASIRTSSNPFPYFPKYSRGLIQPRSLNPNFSKNSRPSKTPAACALALANGVYMAAVNCIGHEGDPKGGLQFWAVRS